MDTNISIDSIPWYGSDNARFQNAIEECEPFDAVNSEWLLDSLDDFVDSDDLTLIYAIDRDHNKILGYSLVDSEHEIDSDTIFGLDLNTLTTTIEKLIKAEYEHGISYIVLPEIGRYEECVFKKCGFEVIQRANDLTVLQAVPV